MRMAAWAGAGAGRRMLALAEGAGRRLMAEVGWAERWREARAEEAGLSLPPALSEVEVEACHRLPSLSVEERVGHWRGREEEGEDRWRLREPCFR